MPVPEWPTPPNLPPQGRWSALGRWALVGIAVGWIALFVSFIWRLDTQFPHPDPANERDMDGLRQTTLTARPLINAVKSYRRKKGRVPETLNELYPSYLTPSTMEHDSTGTSWERWRYSPSGSRAYQLYYKINWDAGIRYDSDNPKPAQWVFDPGDGGQSTRIAGP